MSLRRWSVTKRFIIVFMVLLTPISLNAQTSAQYGSIGVVLEKELHPGDRAPTGGVLVPWPQYYYYNEMVERVYDSEVHPPECNSCLNTALLTGLSFFAIGFASGVYLGSK
jgi:hypothetical protein